LIRWEEKLYNYLIKCHKCDLKLLRENDRWEFGDHKCKSFGSSKKDSLIDEGGIFKTEREYACV
jgi:hypothetical protein